MLNKAVCFEKSNVEDLQKKLMELLLDETKVDSYKSTAQDYVCEKYTWDSVVRDTLLIYGR